MNDEDFVESFETCRLKGEDFHHREHVRLAWLYLRRHALLEALVKFSEGLKNFAAAKGKAGLYHETITWSYIFLINERMARQSTLQTWEEFAAANLDLLDWKENILQTYYREETLRSEMAKRMFIFPDGNARGREEG